MECLPLNGTLPLRRLFPKLRTSKLLRLTSSTSPVKIYAFVKLKLISTEERFSTTKHISHWNGQKYWLKWTLIIETYYWDYLHISKAFCVF